MSDAWREQDPNYEPWPERIGLKYCACGNVAVEDGYCQTCTGPGRIADPEPNAYVLSWCDTATGTMVQTEPMGFSAARRLQRSPEGITKGMMLTPTGKYWEMEQF